jgi:hypothetical protein
MRLRVAAVVAVVLASVAAVATAQEKKVASRKTQPHKQAAKPRHRVVTPSFDVTETAAFKYGEMSKDDCEAELTSRKIPFTSEPTDGVLAAVRLTGPIKGVTFRTRLKEDQRATSTWEIADCRLVLALDDFADVLVAHDIVEVRHYSMHRKVPDSWPAGKVGSQHFGGLAIDAAIFVTKDGEQMDVLDDFSGKIGAKTCGPDAHPIKKTAKSTALREILCETAAKRIFNVILTPNHNRPHRNHFHLDVTPGAKWFVVD